MTQTTEPTDLATLRRSLLDVGTALDGLLALVERDVAGVAGPDVIDELEELRDMVRHAIDRLAPERE